MMALRVPKVEVEASGAAELALRFATDSDSPRDYPEFFYLNFGHAFFMRIEQTQKRGRARPNSQQLNLVRIRNERLN